MGKMKFVFTYYKYYIQQASIVFDVIKKAFSREMGREEKIEF
jgi:hypothetical protein